MLVLPITAATYIDASCWKPSGGWKLNKGPDCIKPADRQHIVLVKQVVCWHPF